MRLVSFILFLLTLLIALAFGSENGHLVSVNFLFIKIELPLSAIILSSFILGAGVCLTFISIRKVFNKSNA